MNVPLSDGKHRFVRENSKSALEIRGKIQSKTKLSSRKNLSIFFFQQNYFPIIFFSNFVLDVARTEFCLDYIPQLYFVFNYLIVCV